MRSWLEQKVRKSRRRKYNKAVDILRREYERHHSAGHSVMFEAVNESRVILICNYCPEVQTMGRRGEDFE